MLHFTYATRVTAGRKKAFVALKDGECENVSFFVLLPSKSGGTAFLHLRPDGHYLK